MSDPIALPVPKNAALLSNTTLALSDLHAILSSNPNYAYLVRQDQDTFAVFKSAPTDAEIASAQQSIASFSPPAKIPSGATTLPDHPTFDDLVAAVRQLQGQTK